ncbi:TPA: hypothetical protein ACJXXT_000262 [Pseudomonas aeruginosa]
MNNNILKAVAMLSLTAFSLNSFAGYTYFLQMEGGAGGLPKGTIAFVEKSSSTPPVNNGGNEGGTGTDPEQTDPTEPTEPTDPETPTEPESKPRSLVFSGNFASYSGESSLWTEGKQAAFATSSYTLVIKGALVQDKTYYFTNNGKECAVIADVCETIASQNRCGPFTSKNLSGTNTILSLQGAQDRSCVGVNSLWGQPVVNGLQVFDGPKPE